MTNLKSNVLQLLIAAVMLVTGCYYLTLKNLISPMVFTIHLNLLIIFLFVCVGVHEAGHFLFCRLVGLKVDRIVIGKGPSIWNKQFGPTRLRVGLSLGPSYCVPVFETNRHIRKKFLIWAGGGILFQILIIAACVIRFDFHFSHFGGKTGIVVSNVFVIANAAILILNLFPWKYHYIGFDFANDAINLFKTFVLDQDEIHNLISAPMLLKAHDVFVQKNYNHAIKAYKHVIEAFPQTFMAWNNLAVSYMKIGDYKNAHDTLENMTRLGFDPKYDFIHLCNAAWLGLLKGDENSLETAEKFSYQAFVLNPVSRQVRINYGICLIANQKTDAGITFLSKDIRINRAIDDKDNTLIGICCLSYAWFKKGEIQTARKYLAKLEPFSDRMEPDDRVLCQRMMQDMEKDSEH